MATARLRSAGPTVFWRIGGEARDGSRLVVVLEVREGMRGVLRFGELLSECRQTLEIGELPR